MMAHHQRSADLAAARAYRKLGDHEAAAHHLSEVRALRTEDYVLNAGLELTERGLLHLALGETEEALRCAEEAVAVHRRNHQRYSEGHALHALSLARRAVGDEEGAAAAEALAAEAHRDCGVPMP
jgi:tetratricopeptide (TPR) repeat protein